MDNRVTFHTETAAQACYLVATLQNSTDLVRYQMQMLAQNDIRNLIPAKMRRQNNAVQIYYNVTSHMTLKQATSRAKISKQDFLSLLDGLIAAYGELDEYQLVDSGMMLDEDFIFVGAGGLQPHFIYLPIYDKGSGMQSLKDFLLQYILQSKIEVTNDNFIQIMLETLNAPSCTLADLQSVIVRFKNPAKGRPPAREAAPRESVQIRYEPPAPPPHNPEAPMQACPPTPAAPAASAEPATAAPAPKAAKPQKTKAPKQQKPRRDPAPKGNAPAKKMLYGVIQVLFLAGMITAALKGWLLDESGQLNISYLFGMLIAVAGVDFVIFREMFVNGNKDKKKKQQKPGKQAQASKASAAPRPAAMAPSALPAAQGSAIPPQNVPRDMPPASFAQPPACPPPQQVPAAPVPAAETAGDGETVIMTAQNSSGAYLEYYENGLLQKIWLDKPSVLIGKLRGRVDYVILNDKVSKVHAEFTCQDGQYFVKDYNSLNGTYLNGSHQRINSNVEYPLANGDHIALADTELILRC